MHLSVLGYLALSGRLLATSVPGQQHDDLEPGPSRTLLAGWSPGQTYWLTDVLEPAGAALRWSRHEQRRGDLGWSLAEEGRSTNAHRPHPSR